MTLPGGTSPIMSELDDATRGLVRAAAALAGGSEESIRRELAAAAVTTPAPWMEELLLQTYLFAGFPRALNGMREWRRHAPRPAPAADVRASDVTALGEATCARVYGDMYERLRENVRALHPRLDDWMITEGYGKVLSRPGLDLPRRELCIVAACAATGQDRQLLSHLHGAVNVGVSDALLTATIDALAGLVPDPLRDRARSLWNRIAQ